MNVKYAKYCEFELTPENYVIIVDNWLNEIILIIFNSDFKLIMIS